MPVPATADRTDTARTRAFGGFVFGTCWVLLTLLYLAGAARGAGTGPETGAGAETNVLDFAPDLVRAGWRHLKLPGFEPADFTPQPDGSLQVASNAGVSMVYRDISGPTRTRNVLTWEWRVDAPVPATDITRAENDDRDLAVHLWFPTANSSLPSAGGLVRSLFGVPDFGRMVTYVWGGELPRGSRFDNPHYRKDGRMMVLRPGGTAPGEWHAEQVDWREDYRDLFGEEPVAPPRYIAISADGDDTGSFGSGRIRAITLLPAATAETR